VYKGQLRFVPISPESTWQYFEEFSGVTLRQGR
jgi:hypothetical protein